MVEYAGRGFVKSCVHRGLGLATGKNSLPEFYGHCFRKTKNDGKMGTIPRPPSQVVKALAP